MFTICHVLGSSTPVFRSLNRNAVAGRFRISVLVDAPHLRTPSGVSDVLVFLLFLLFLFFVLVLDIVVVKFLRHHSPFSGRPILGLVGVALPSGTLVQLPRSSLHSRRSTLRDFSPVSPRRTPSTTLSRSTLLSARPPKVTDTLDQ